MAKAPRPPRLQIVPKGSSGNVEKTARKTAPQARVVGRPFIKGQRDPRAGRGPAKGAPNAGRPRNEHVEWCRQMVSSKECEQAVAAVLNDKSHPAFSTMWRAVSDRAYGKAVQPISDPDGKPIQAIAVTLVRPEG